MDLPARYGGEEFVVVLPACPAEDAVAIAEQLREAIATRSDGPDGPAVTASAGVATLPGSASSPEELVRAADTALYESKRAGRDRVTLSPPTHRSPTHRSLPSSRPECGQLLGSGAPGRGIRWG